MEKVLLGIIAVSGLCAVSAHAGRRVYHFVSEQKNWTEAQSYCREKYTDLVTVDNMEDVMTLNNMADKTNYSDHAWIGLHDDKSSWVWSLSDRSFYKPGEAKFRRWGPGCPTDVNSGRHCVSMLGGGEWQDSVCDNLFKAVCSDVKGPNVTFVLTDNNLTWAEARSFCGEHYTDLASVRNLTENQKVQDLVPGGTVWIGLFRVSLKWSDGSKSTFRHWRAYSGKPGDKERNETCVAADFSTSGRWAALSCDWKRAFICYSVPEMKVMKVRFERKDSSLDLNDPAVMEDILKQLKQKLKDQGVNDNVRLSWRKQSDGKVFHKEEKKNKRKKTNDEL